MKCSREDCVRRIDQEVKGNAVPRTNRLRKRTGMEKKRRMKFLTGSRSRSTYTAKAEASGFATPMAYGSVFTRKQLVNLHRKNSARLTTSTHQAAVATVQETNLTIIRFDYHSI